MSSEEVELLTAIERVLNSPSPKKLVVAGPGTGKTALFKQLLEDADWNPDGFLVLTFINNLKNELETQLSKYATVKTLHSYCLGLLYRSASLRGGLSSDFYCLPGLARLIRSDWKHFENREPPHFIRQMRNLDEKNDIPFYLARGEYYDAVDFDDTVYRVYERLTTGAVMLKVYDLVLIDEYQDFNRLEAGFIELLAETSQILIAGDDDQALYSHLRDSSWNYIRSLHRGGEYEVFELPFCMRCPKVVVDAVNDVIAYALELTKLEGRIQKPYKYFAPAKGEDSEKYPRIALVQTSVQRQSANYMGRYIAQEISMIPNDEIEEATRYMYPAILIIVSKPYRTQIVEYLESVGYAVETNRDLEEVLDRDCGLEILKKDQESNLGWRLVLEDESPSFVASVIKKTADRAQRLVNFLPSEYRQRILAEAEAWNPGQEESGDGQQHEKSEGKPTAVRVTSFEGAKGLSAQHVFIAGLHDGEIPRDPHRIEDLEICKFVVGLTRTRKKCYLVYTRHFADQWKTRSSFISWIDSGRMEPITVDAAYWRRQAQSEV